MNQQYARNLHNLAQASKDYTDNKTSELYDILSEFEPYKVKESDVTITGTSSPYPVTLSSALETAVLSGKRAMFVSGTIMNALTQGNITTDTFFNVISYDKLTQTGMKHVIVFSTYTDNPLGGFLTLNAGFFQDDNNQWYVVCTAGGIDTDMITTQISQMQTDVGNLTSDVITLSNDVNSLDMRVQALEIGLYEHHIMLYQASNQYAYRSICFTLTCSIPSFTKSTLFTYLTTKLLNAVISATGYNTSSPAPYYDSIVYAIKPESEGLRLNVLKNTNTDGTLDQITTSYYSSSAYNHSSTTLTDTVIQIL